MRFFRSSRRLAWAVTAVSGASWLLCGALPATAQPDVIDPSVFDVKPRVTQQQHTNDALLEQTQLVKFNELKKQLAATEKTDPAAAAQRYREFMVETTNLRPVIGITVSTIVAPLLQAAKDPAALPFLDEAIAKYEAYPYMVRLLATKAKLLIAGGRPAEAIPLFENNWPKFALAGPVEGASALGQYAALSWAKLRFMECAFDAQAINQAARLLAKAMQAKDPTRAQFTDFVAAQKDTAQPNSLAAVALPKVEQAKLKTLWDGINTEPQ